MALNYVPSTRNVDHTKSVALELSTLADPILRLPETAVR